MKMRRSVGLLMLLFIFFLPARLYPSEDNTYLQDLINKAIDKKIYKERYWYILLHYKKSISGIKSLVDDPAFFISPGGKYDPETELIETLKSLFKEYQNEQDDPRCKFPARYTWLKETLNIDESLLHPSTCPEFEKFLKAVNPKSATLVFPSAYMNSPASMFGHTLIRIDSTYKSKLMSYAINYAANTGDEGGITYLIKGLFGFFKGYFSILPYYEKIEEYNDLDMRDMWEYELNLTEEEVRRMVFHIWELKDIYSYYYFFDENCSYNLLFLLEAARPEVNLTDEFGQWVIPSDTVRLVINRGLLRDIHYRPSRSTRIRHMASYLNKENRGMTMKIADGTLSPQDIMNKDMNNNEKAIILDIAAEMTQYKFMRQEIDKESYQKRFLDILTVRKDLGRPDPVVYSISPPSRPDEGHASGKISTGIGIRDDEYYQGIMFRPAYHDLIDSDEGFQKGSEIIFGGLELRYYFKENSIRLQRLDIIDILSIGVRDEFFKPVSWKIYAGIIREVLQDGKEHLLYLVNPGFGLAKENKIAGIYYGFAESELRFSKRFDTDYSVGIGFSAGILKNITDGWKVKISGKAIFYELGDRNKLYSGSIQQNYTITNDIALRANLTRSKSYSEYWTEAEIFLNFYF